jgi:hypothetical protein
VRHRRGVASDGGESSSSGRKLWTGNPSSVCLVAALRSAALERCALATMELRAIFGGLFVVIVEQDRLERLAHVPFEMVSEHAQQDVSAHAVGSTMMNRAYLEIDGLDAAEGAFDACELFVGLDRRGGVEDLGREAGEQHVDAIERGFCIDLCSVALEYQVVVRDGDDKMFGHFVVVEVGADRERDLILAA